MLNYLDLFAGAGGLSEGFIKAGYNPIAHIEMDKGACFSLRTRAAYHWLKDNKNLNIYYDYLNNKMTRDDFYKLIPQQVTDTVLNYEISEDNLEEIFFRVDNLLDRKKLDVIVGGPPCQAYSLAGRSRDKNHMVGDKRNYLYKLYAEFLKKYQPEYFVFENVLGLLSAKDDDGTLHFDNMRKLFSDYGYATEYKILNASNYGVLQNRKRIILIGSLKEKKDFYPNIKEVRNNYLVGEVFNDLPKVHAGDGVITPVSTLNYEGSYLYDVGIKDSNFEKITFHQARSNNNQDLEIYRIAVEQWNKKHKRLSYSDLPVYLQSHKNKETFLDRFKVVAADLPSSQTIVAHIARDGHYYIHPDIAQNRSLTPREAARIQTFPDSYYFESATGKPSRTFAFKQIGNAVPVQLAFCVATALKHNFIKGY